jgi:hypothetical protein
MSDLSGGAVPSNGVMLSLVSPSSRLSVAERPSAMLDIVPPWAVRQNPSQLS